MDIADIQNANVASVWLSTSEAGEILALSSGHVVKLIREGKLTAYQPGGRAYKLRREDVMAYLESTRVQVDTQED